MAKDKTMTDVTVKPFNYAMVGVPDGYICGRCNIDGVKLWREYNAFLDHQQLLCGDCASKDQDRPVDISDSDQIGWMVPAIPTEDGKTYWGYTSVPQDGCDWWHGLPLNHTRTVERDVMEDPYMTLREWADKVTQLIKQYGEEAIMCTDAGHNNVTLVVIDSIDAKG